MVKKIFITLITIGLLCGCTTSLNHKDEKGRDLGKEFTTLKMKTNQENEVNLISQYTQIKEEVIAFGYQLEPALDYQVIKLTANDNLASLYSDYHDNSHYEDDFETRLNQLEEISQRVNATIVLMNNNNQQHVLAQIENSKIIYRFDQDK